MKFHDSGRLLSNDEKDEFHKMLGRDLDKNILSSNQDSVLMCAACLDSSEHTTHSFQSTEALSL